MRRLIVSFVALLIASALLVAALGLYAQQTFTRLAGHTTKVLRENYDSVQYMDEVISAVQGEDRFVLARLADGQTTPTALVPALAQFRRRFETAFAREKGNVTVPGEAEAVKRLRLAADAYFADLEAFWYRLPAIAQAQRLTAYEQSAGEARAQLLASATLIRDLNHKSMETTASRNFTGGPRLIIFGTVVTVVLLAAVGTWMGQRLARQVRELQALRTHFVAIASHELRTPVTSMRMALDLLKSGSLGTLAAEQQPVVEAALEDCDRLLALSRQLLDVTKIQSGQLGIHPSAVEAQSLVADSVTAVHKLVQEKRLTLELDVPEGARIQADPVKAVWVLTNLLANAVRYTPQGGQIRVDGRTRGSEILLSVSDTGPGIAPQVAPKVFHPYYQAHQHPGGHPVRGTAGLGLTIAQEIVAAHGGRIWVEPRPFLSGATITFTLPLAKEG